MKQDITPRCKHGHAVTFVNVEAEINDDAALDVVLCDKCYEHPDLKVGDYRIIYIDEMMVFASKEE